MFRKHPPLKVLKIGFTGSREGMSYKQLRTVGQIVFAHVMIEYLPIEWHHGDCIGADELSHAFAKSFWCRVIIHPPDDDTYRAWCSTKPEFMRPPLPYLRRNQNIVDETHVLIAAPDSDERQRSGTWSTVRYARSIGRPIFIARTDGRLLMEGRWP